MAKRKKAENSRIPAIQGSVCNINRKHTANDSYSF